MPPPKLDLLAAVDRQITEVFDPHVVGDVNDAQIKVAKIGPVFDWHAHQDEDEAFLVLRGRMAIDFRDGTMELGEGELVVVPRTIEHRPRALTHEPVVLLFEPANTLNTGDVVSERTVSAPKRLRPVGG